MSLNLYCCFMFNLLQFSFVRFFRYLKSKPTTVLASKPQCGFDYRLRLKRKFDEQVLIFNHLMK